MLSYTSGVVNDVPALLGALTSGLLGAGWSQDGDIYFKDGCHVEISLNQAESPFPALPNTMIKVQGGTDHASGALVNPSGVVSRIGTAPDGGLFEMDFPASYELWVFDDPQDEVYLIVNYGGDRYQFMAFGRSRAPGLPGNGTYTSSTFGGDSEGLNGTAGIIAQPVTSGSTTTTVGWSVPLFLEMARPGGQVNPGRRYSHALHHDYDGNGWANQAMAAGQDWSTGSCRWQPFAAPLYERSPSQIAQAAPLLPIDVYVGRPSGGISLVLSLAHARALRIDDFNPGQIIEIGPDSWKVFPFHRKNVDARDGSASGIDHTGTLGWAIRMAGP